MLAVLSLFYLFLRASFALLGCVEPLPMSLGTKLSCSFHLTFFGFAMLLGHWFGVVFMLVVLSPRLYLEGLAVASLLQLGSVGFGFFS